MTYADEWLTIHTPKGVYVWQFGQPTEEQRNDWIVAARIATEMPPGDEWIHKRDTGWSVSRGGEPAPKMLERDDCTVGTVEQLEALDAKALERYRQAHAKALLVSHGEQALEHLRALSALDPDAVAGALGSIRGTVTP